MLGAALGILAAIGAVQVVRTTVRLTCRLVSGFCDGARTFGRALGRACRPVPDRRDESTALALTALSAAVAALSDRADRAETMTRELRGEAVQRSADPGKRQVMSVAEVLACLEARKGPSS